MIPLRCAMSKKNGRSNLQKRSGSIWWAVTKNAGEAGRPILRQRATMGTVGDPYFFLRGTQLLIGAAVCPVRGRVPRRRTTQMRRYSNPFRNRRSPITAERKLFPSVGSASEAGPWTAPYSVEDSTCGKCE
jgi:hypothetical protein